MAVPGNGYRHEHIKVAFEICYVVSVSPPPLMYAAVHTGRLVLE